jgi:DNA-directed RNA polymerase subunit RPC12/RpoP
MILFVCHACQTQLSAEQSYAGALMRCPTCFSAVRVPGQAAAVAVGAGGASGEAAAPIAPSVPPPLGRGIASGRRYGFNCGYCSSRLEANESMAAQEGQCPTCGNNITIPILDRYGRLIDPKTRQIIKQDPHPVHAYAAAGERAPQIIRRDDGSQVIQCPRCQAVNPISGNNCKGCGMPFTMEGTTVDASGGSNGFCVASLVLGIISIPGACMLVPALLAVVFGIIGYNQVSKAGPDASGKGMAIAGIVCGLVGGLLAFWWMVA